MRKQYAYRDTELIYHVPDCGKKCCLHLSLHVRWHCSVMTM